MLIVEELHLLLLRADGRNEAAGAGARMYGEIAAVIVDLVLHGRVVVTEGKRPTVHVVSTEPTGHPVLDSTLAALTPDDGQKLSSVVTRSRLDPRDVVAEVLIAQGVLSRGERGFFGMGAERTPERDPAPEAALRGRLVSVLSGQIPASQADMTLLGILQGMQAARSVLRAETAGVSATQLAKRIEQIVADSPAADAVAKAVSSIVVAIMTAGIIPPMVVATTS